MDKIDFILTWVDDSDEKWLKSRAEYLGDNNPAAAHYRDWGTLRYWFRCVAEHAAWVNKIHFVTCGQIPEWLNTADEKINVVSHEDYIPADCLPTFSVNPIELNFHRIDGLSEQFVYFNDDTFVAADTAPDDFFKNSLPCDSFGLSSLIPSVKGEVITYILFNDLMLINSNFNKRSCAKGNLKKWLSPKYGKSVFRNLYYLPIGKFSGFINPHLPNSFLKSTFEEAWAAEGDVLSEVSHHRFREISDVNQYLFRYWQLVQGKFTPRTAKIGACYSIGNDDGAIAAHIGNKDMKLICLNDDPNMSDEQFITRRAALIELFEKSYPNKCRFEK